MRDQDSSILNESELLFLSTSCIVDQVNNLLYQIFEEKDEESSQSLDFTVGRDAEGISFYLQSGYWYEFMPHYFETFGHVQMRMKVFVDNVHLLRLSEAYLHAHSSTENLNYTPRKSTA